MNRASSRKRVAHISLIITEYKDHLYCALAKEPDIELVTFHGREPKKFPPYDIGKCQGFPDVYVKNVYFRNSKKVFLAFQFLFVPLFRFNPDIIVLQDGVKIVSNYLILLYAKLLHKKIIWYTHGENRQEFRRNSISARIRESIRLIYLRISDAVIAYSHGVKQNLIQRGIIAEKIFVALNTLDVNQLFNYRAGLERKVIEQTRNEHNLAHKKTICYIGRLINDKKPQYFLSLIHELNKIDADKYFGFIIGDGPLYSSLQRMAERDNINNVFFTGRISLLKSLKYLCNSDIVFVPGMTGLAIVHAFCCGVPYITFNLDIHSPEIEYLSPGDNGLLTTPQSYVKDICALLDDAGKIEIMKKNALATAKGLTTEKQIAGFRDAIAYVTN